jgi:hypothetical protein
MDMVHRNVTGPLGQAIDQGLTTTGPAVSTGKDTVELLLLSRSRFKTHRMG